MDLSEYCPRRTVDIDHPNETWAEYNARVGVQLLSDADWDGIFIDRADATPSMVVGGPFARSIDPRRDNTPVSDGYAALNASWRTNLRIYESSIRDAAGSRVILTNNAYPNFDLLNGMMFEAMPRLTWNAHTWSDRMLERLRSSAGPTPIGPIERSSQTSRQSRRLRASSPRQKVVRATSSPVGARPNYRKMRFGLGTALLKDGFFNYGASTSGHAAGGLFWFDEFDNNGAGRGYLGAPIGAAEVAPPLTTRDLVSGHGAFSTKSLLDKWHIYAPRGYAVSKSVSSGAARSE